MVTATAILLLCAVPNVDGADQQAGLSTAQLDSYGAAVQKARRCCGPLAVWYCLHRLGRQVDVEDVMHRIPVEEKGASLDSLGAALDDYGVAHQFLRATERNVARLPSPCILVLGGSHCIVSDGMTADGTGLRVFDPARRWLKVLPIGDLQRSWDGTCIVFAPPKPSRAVTAARFGLGAVTGWLFLMFGVRLVPRGIAAWQRDWKPA